MRPRISIKGYVRRSVRPSVRRSVRRSVTLSWKVKKCDIYSAKKIWQNSFDMFDWRSRISMKYLSVGRSVGQNKWLSLYLYLFFAQGRIIGLWALFGPYPLPCNISWAISYFKSRIGAEQSRSKWGAEAGAGQTKGIGRSTCWEQIEKIGGDKTR